LPAGRRTVRIAALTERTRELFESLIAAYETALPDVDFKFVPASDSLQFLEFVQDGRADIGLASSDRAYSKYLDDLAGNPRLDRLRGIAALWVLRIHLLAGRASAVHRVADVRGRRVGNFETLTPSVGLRLILAAFGIELSEVDLKGLPAQDLVAGLTDGSLDAAFIIAGIAEPAVNEALAAGARLIPIAGPAVERLRLEYPFFRLATIPAGTYQGSSRSTKTLGIPGAVVCRSDLPEPLVYELTKGLFEFLSEASTRPPVPFFPIESAPAVAIPLHDGAARYYRERELFR
jgi:TRAP transporter TAXI family solute receptor